MRAAASLMFVDRRVRCVLRHERVRRHREPGNDAQCTPDRPRRKFAALLNGGSGAACYPAWNRARPARVGECVCRKRSWRAQMGQRVTPIVVALGVAFAGMFANSADYATCFREHKPVRYTLNPVAQVISMVGLASPATRSKSQRAVDQSRRKDRARRSSLPRSRWCCSWSSVRPRVPRIFQLGGYSLARPLPSSH